MEGEEEGRNGTTGTKRKNNKLIRRKYECPYCVFGVDICIDEVMEATETILIVRVQRSKFSANYITEWANLKLSYSPENQWKSKPYLGDGLVSNLRRKSTWIRFLRGTGLLGRGLFFLGDGHRYSMHNARKWKSHPFG